MRLGMVGVLVTLVAACGSGAAEDATTTTASTTTTAIATTTEATTGLRPAVVLKTGVEKPARTAAV